jgi:HK97 family phage portal protein
MSIRDLFKPKLKNQYIEQVKLVKQNGNAYISFRGRLYHSDIVLACIRPKVKEVGKLVAKHIRKYIDDEGHTSLTVNPDFNIKMLLEDPNPLMSGQLLQEKMTMQLCLNSNAYALISRNDNGVPIAIYPLAPRSVEAVWKPDLWLRFWNDNGQAVEYPYTDIIHLRQDFNDNDVFGTPIAPTLVPLLDVVKITDQGVINAIKNSSVVQWLLRFTNSLRPDDLKAQAKDFAKNFLDNQNGVGVAAVDAKAEAQQITPHDFVPNAAQMDKTTQRIYALFNTNVKIVTSSANEEERQSYFDAEVEPVERQLGDEYTRKLFSRVARSYGNRITFEAGAWDGATFGTKLNLVQMVDRGAMSINEWRYAMNLAPTEDGDVFIRRLDTGISSANTEEGGND